MFTYTTAISKLRAMTARKKAVQGGTYGGKTHGIIPILIDRAARTPRLKITVVNESIPAAKDGPVKIFKDVMEDTGRWFEDRWIQSPLEYTFANKSVIQFKSFDTVTKAKQAGKRDILFINECNFIPHEVADALMIRSIETWLDYNPDNQFWVHTEVMKDPNSEMIILTYRDNEAIPPEIMEYLMYKREKAKTSSYWENWCRVYLDGEIGSLQGAIYSNWTQISELPKDARLLGIGLDFGYTNDPSAAVAVYKMDDKVIIDEVFYRNEMLNRDIAKELKVFNCEVIADSAEPKSIRELQLLGLKCYATQKGADSIDNGIQLVQGLDLLVTSRSINIIKEFRSYCWDKDRTGEQQNRPIDKHNHAMDALRYFVMTRMGVNKTKIRIR